MHGIAIWARVLAWFGAGGRRRKRKERHAGGFRSMLDLAVAILSFQPEAGDLLGLRPHLLYAVSLVPGVRVAAGVTGRHSSRGKDSDHPSC